MKTLLTYLLLPIIVLVFGYYYAKEKPDVRYTLSDRIPVKITEGSSSQSIQQLEVKNVGNGEAKQIQLVIKGKLVSYNLLKYSKADLVKEFTSDESTEIIYPSLPPQASFKLLITSLGDGIGKAKLVINHSQGKASEALSQGSAYPAVITVVVLLIYGFAVAWIVKTGAVDSLESKADYRSDSILKRKRKPFYVNTARWSSIRKKAIEAKIAKDKAWGSADIANSQSYVLLNVNRPDYLSEEEWHSSLKLASEALSTMLSQATVNSYSSSQVLGVLRTPKPRHLQEKDWNKSVTKTSEIFLLMLKKEFRYSREDELIRAMKEERPEEVPEDTWSKYMAFLKDEYFRILHESIERQASPLQYLDKQKLEFLHQEKADDLREHAYNFQLRRLPNILKEANAEAFIKSERPNWIQDADYNLLLEKAKRVIDLEILTNKYESLVSSLKNIIDQRPLLPRRPDGLTDDEWQDLLRIDTEIRTCRQDSGRMAGDAKAVADLKAKIERQLDIIHDVLHDPSSIDRIEEYNNVFAPGNFANLKALSEHLKAMS